MAASLALAAALGGCDSAQRTTPAAVPDLAADSALDPLSIPAGRAFDARAARIHDGDSFDLAIPHGAPRVGIRISGIDAPERRQPYADIARKHLQALIGQQRIRVHVLGHDRYGRILGQVEVLAPARAAGTASDGPAADTPGRDVGQAQLEAGLAWFYRRYERDLPAAWRNRYDQAEMTARQQHRGLWRDPAPVEPWRYRESRRNAGRGERSGVTAPASPTPASATPASATPASALTASALTVSAPAAAPAPSRPTAPR